MRDIKTLIKMQKLYVDQQRRALAQKQEEADAIMMEIASLQANLEIEKARASAEPEYVSTIGDFIRKELDRNKRLQRKLSAKEREVELERQKLSILFEELKRYEIAQENWEDEERREQQKRENIQYDEFAGQRHHRGENS